MHKKCSYFSEDNHITTFKSHTLNQYLKFQTCYKGKRSANVKTWYAPTVWLKSQTGCPILYCKRPIWRVGVWPKWVGPAHSTLGQSIPYTSRLTYSKMNHFCPVVLKWHTFVFLSSQLWLILLLSG